MKCPFCGKESELQESEDSVHYELNCSCTTTGSVRLIAKEQVEKESIVSKYIDNKKGNK